MVTELIASRDFTWNGWRPEVDDARIFKENYTVIEEAETVKEFFKTQFADLPSAGIWADRTQSDEELLEELGSGWRGFAKEL